MDQPTVPFPLSPLPGSPSGAVSTRGIQNVFQNAQYFALFSTDALICFVVIMKKGRAAIQFEINHHFMLAHNQVYWLPTMS